jgi:hypothetical protein
MSGKAEQKATSLGGTKNLGSNRNAEGTRQVTNREHQVAEAHGAVPEFTKDQTRRQHSQGVFESKGESGKREVKRYSWPPHHVKIRSGSLRRSYGCP